MKVAFLQPEWVDHYGIMCLSTVLKKNGHQVGIFIEPAHRNFLSAVSEFKPDMIGLRCVTVNYDWVVKTAMACKRVLSSPVVVGGVHATLCPQIIENPAIDIVCRGEGEYPLLELVEAMEKGNDYTGIPNLWVKKDGTIYKNEIRRLVEDLDEFYPPDRALYMDKYEFFRKYPWKNVMAGRGCPFSCAYCYNNALKKEFHGKGKYVRWRSPENITSEIKLLVEKYGAKVVHFSDDTFALGDEWLFKFLERYKQDITIPFICNIRADIMEEEMAKSLKEAGCYGAFFGVESGNEDMRVNILKKKITNEQIIKAGEILHKYGIRFQTNNMFSLPGETFEQAMETVTLNIKIKTDFPAAYTFQPYPGLELTQYAIEKGYLSADTDKSYASYFIENPLKQKETNQISNLQKLFYIAVKMPFLLPLVKFFCHLPPNPLFYLVYLASFAIRYTGAHRVNILDTIYFAMHEWDIFRGRRREVRS